MRQLMHDPLAAVSESSSTLADLVFGWSNESWSAEPELLSTCIRQTVHTRESILECGSGLSTIILGAVAQQIGKKVWALEHMPEWADRVSQHLSVLGIDSVQICVAPLSSYGEFDWYELPPEVKDQRFDFVLCDGPPSNTLGGRYGLVPLLRPYLMGGCVILLDDAERESEQQIASRWADELPGTVEQIGTNKPFFRLVVDGGAR
jgi:predicted O-methyltransferase YrrM